MVDPKANPSPGVPEPGADAKADVKGPECPTCGDRFPSKETLQEHMTDAHQAG